MAVLPESSLPAAVAMCGFYFLAWVVYQRRARPLQQAALWAGVLLACMTPWMVDMRHKEGTFLFPILGRGYDASAYGIIPLPNGSHEAAGSAATWVWLTSVTDSAQDSAARSRSV